MAIKSSATIKTPDTVALERYVTIIEMMKDVRDLLADPKSLKVFGDASAAAMSLTENEIKERDAAVALLEELEVKKSELAETEKNIGKRENKLIDDHAANTNELAVLEKNIKAAAAERNAQLDEREGLLSTRERDIAARETAHQVASAALDERHAKVKTEAEALEPLKAEIDAFKARLTG